MEELVRTYILLMFVFNVRCFVRFTDNRYYYYDDDDDDYIMFARIMETCRLDQTYLCPKRYSEQITLKTNDSVA